MKSEKIRLYVIEITLVIFFLLAMIFNETITRTVLAIILLVFMAITVKLVKSEKMNLTTEPSRSLRRLPLPESAAQDFRCGC